MLWTDLERAVCAVKVQKFFQASVQDSSTEVRNFDIIAAAQGVTLDNESKDPHYFFQDIFCWVMLLNELN